MNQTPPTDAKKKNDEELNRMMRKFIFWGSIKLLILAAISAAFVYWYMY